MLRFLGHFIMMLVYAFAFALTGWLAANLPNPNPELVDWVWTGSLIVIAITSMFMALYHQWQWMEASIGRFCRR